MITLMIGVKAFMMPARIEETLSCANAKSTPGSTFSNIPTTHNWRIRSESLIIRIFLKIRTNQRANAPSAQRRKATPTGVRKVNERSMNKNEAPHVIPKAKYEGSQFTEYERIIFFLI